MKDVKIFDGSAWVSIVGPAGKDGVDGKDGSGVTIKGTAAVYPPDAAPTTGDMWIVPDPVPAGFPGGTNPGDGLVWTGTAWNNVGGIRGPKGQDGVDGADGAPGQDGQPGADGLGFNPVGAWAACTDYNVRDVVTHNGSSYVQIAAPGDSCATPDSDPAAWQLLAASGSAGADGAPGADGAKGDKGDQGDPGADGADGRSVAVTKSPTQPATAAIGDFWLEE